MKRGKLNVFHVIVKKYLHFIIPIVGLIAFELMAPLFGSGPVYGLVSREVVEKCEMFWWRHIFAVGNREVGRTCAGYMFMTSVTIQLLVIGLFLIYLLSRRPKTGVSICFLVFVSSVYKLYQDSKKLSAPVAFTSPFSIPHIKEFFYVAHFPLTTHLIGYTSGLILTFALENGLRIYKSTGRNLGIHLTIQIFLSTITIFLPGLHNVLNIVPRSMYPSFILFLRFSYMSTMFHCFIFSYHWRDYNAVQEETKLISSNNNTVTKKGIGENKVWRSIMDAFLSISLSMAVVNYPFTRWNQIISRTPVPFTDLYSLSCRALYSMQFVLILGFFFHIFFVSPFENLMKMYFDSNRKDSGIKKIE